MELVDMRGSKPRPVRDPGSIPGVGNSVTPILYIFNLAWIYIKNSFYLLLPYLLLVPSLPNVAQIKHYLAFDEFQTYYFYAFNWLRDSVIMTDAFHMFFFYLVVVIALSLLYIAYFAR